MLPLLTERKNDFNANTFMNELFMASKAIGCFEAKIDTYQFSSLLMPIFQIKESISSMEIEGTQTTLSDILEDRISTAKDNEQDSAIRESDNNIKALVFGANYLDSNPFSEDLIKSLHKMILDGIVKKSKIETLGRYKQVNNYIVNSSGSVVYTPPEYTETKQYMKDLLIFMNNDVDDINPLIKAAVMHSQFESIHPFEDGNGRVGRLLISLYLYKTKVIKLPFFYISEAFCQDKAVYYNMLTDSRKRSYDEWIRFFLKKCTLQANKFSNYVDSINQIYRKTREKLSIIINSSKLDDVLNTLFAQPIVTAAYLAEKSDISHQRAKRYLDIMVDQHVLQCNDQRRNKQYYFMEVLDLARV